MGKYFLHFNEDSTKWTKNVNRDDTTTGFTGGNKKINILLERTEEISL